MFLQDKRQLSSFAAQRNDFNIDFLPILRDYPHRGAQPFLNPAANVSPPVPAVDDPSHPIQVS